VGAKTKKMNCVLEDGSIFVKVIDGIKDLCPEGNLDFTEHGMQMQVMDAAHVSLCSLMLRTNMFKSYSCPEAMSLGVNFKTLSMVLKNSKGELKLKSDGDRLNVKVQKLTGMAEYTMNLMDIDSEQLGVPETSYAAICVLPSSTFGKVMKDLSDFSDTCSLHIDETLTVTAKGDMGKVVWKGENCKCSVRSQVDPLDFGLRYMCLFSKCAVSSNVVLGMSPDMPICLTFPIEEHGHMRFYLAPKTMD
jgi:proliferating cell nuclear antigen